MMIVIRKKKIIYNYFRSVVKSQSYSFQCLNIILKSYFVQCLATETFICVIITQQL